MALGPISWMGLWILILRSGNEQSGHSTVKYIINEEEEEEKRKGVEMPDILSISSPETCMCENNSTIVRSSQF